MVAVEVPVSDVDVELSEEPVDEAVLDVSEVLVLPVDVDSEVV